MILSRTSQYAIQALTYIATQTRGEPMLNREIAANLHVPSAYLAKIMRSLCQTNLLYSKRGRLGGFALHTGAERMNLMDIVLLVEGERVGRECLLGLKECGDERVCPMHRRWEPVKEQMMSFMREMTLNDLVKAVRNGEYRLSDIPLVVLRR
ncbi:MAG: Rrf2 family transcriptional regulator [Hydrogenophilales bacterium]|nr:Rrf2 family transcriptional regulator [Hydrogenophilales bacterium]